MSTIGDLTTKIRTGMFNWTGKQHQQSCGQGGFIEGGRRAGENDNPYLSARRTWNDHMRSVQSSRNMWQILAILCLLIALAGIGGMIYIGSQSKFIPYVVQVNKLGEAIAVSRADRAAVADQRVVHASLASFINDMRMVTPDVALQRRAVFRAYAMLNTNDAATPKANTWFNGTEASSPFKRAETQTVSVDIISVIPQSPETWQVDWLEKVYDRQGHLTEQPFKMRALIRIYHRPPTQTTTEEQIRNNPLGIFIQDFSWSKQS
ncbi:type IV secretion system protein VirB5 [Nitrosomonas aestuarii]|uniref:Type IV secretion system protein VirB5 n=1 Tax=Nitrosomonas aestuarii TaxID=52441 RepID=A0A1I4GBK6_9PROT|nr:VirB8/TrbF family protein [Nitrosomonas aestuarii]SFL27414.1 type IV secretion system protein VirB5 [Nitrosomonas aestuarii]